VSAGSGPRSSLLATEADPVPARAEVDRIVAADGTGFRVARFFPGGATRGTVVILNGRSEFIEKYFEVIDDLLRRRFVVATLDWRGQGLSDRALPNPHKGWVADFGCYVSDLRRMLERFVAPVCPRPYRLLAHSMGGCIALRYLVLHPETFSSAIFSSPMWGFGRALTAPASLRWTVGLLERIGAGRRYVPGWGDYGEKNRSFAGNSLTRDPERFARFVAQVDAEPRLALGGPTVHWVREALLAIAAIHAPGFVERVGIPVRVCTAGQDSVVSLAAQAAVARRMPNAVQQLFEGAKHELLLERDEVRNRFFALFEEL
jgi:lysophospholipase